MIKLHFLTYNHNTRHSCHTERFFCYSLKNYLNECSFSALNGRPERGFLYLFAWDLLLFTSHCLADSGMNEGGSSWSQSVSPKDSKG